MPPMASGNRARANCDVARAWSMRGGVRRPGAAFLDEPGTLGVLERERDGELGAVGAGAVHDGTGVRHLDDVEAVPGRQDQ